MQESNMHLTSSSVKFVNTAKTYRPVKKANTNLGFGGLLQMPDTCQRRHMIIEIVKRFEPSNQSFRICDQDIQIQLEDVKDIMGLPIEGKNVFSHKGLKGNKTECNKVQQDLFLRFAKGKKPNVDKRPERNYY